MHEESTLQAADSTLTRQLTRFLLAGILAVATDCATYYGLSRLGLPHALAKGVSFCAGSVVAFVLNKFLTFAAQAVRAAEVSRFAALYVSTLAANVTVFAAVMGVVHHTTLAIVAATGTSTVLNFIGQRHWVFRPQRFEVARHSVIDYVPFWVCFVLTAILSRSHYKSVYQRGHMYAEAAVNFFSHAHDSSLLQNITALDYGYVPLLTRLCAVGVQALGVPVALTPVAYQWISLVAASVFFAAFSLPQFRKIIPSDLGRVLVCAGLAMSYDFEIRTFINFSYLAGILVYLWLVLAAEQTTWSFAKATLLGVASAIFVLSKAHFVDFAPALGLVFIHALWRRRFVTAYFVAWPGLASMLQMAVIWAHRGDVGKKQLALRHAFDLWNDHLLFAPLLQLIGRAVVDRRVIAVICACFPLAACAIALRYRRPQWRATVWPTILGLTTFLSGSAFAIATYPEFYEAYGGHYDWRRLLMRHWFIPGMALYFTIACLVAHLVKPRWSPISLAAWLAISMPIGLSTAQHDTRWPYTGFSAWAGFVPYVFPADNAAAPQGCIPIDPYPYLFGRNCNWLQTLSHPEFVLTKDLVPLLPSYPAPQAAQAWEVDAIGMRIAPHQRGNLNLVAKDNEGRTIAQAQEVIAPSAEITYFAFTPPVRAPARIEVISAQAPHVLAVMDTDTTPLWMWVGRKIEPISHDSQASR